MEIDSRRFIDIMKNNFNYKVVNSRLGPGIKMDCFSAFIFSSITGAGYLDDALFPFNPKGLMKVFYNAFDYKLVTGLFDKTILQNTPYNLSKTKDYLFDGDKIVIPVEFDSELKLQKKLNDFIEQIDEKSTNYIIQRIERYKKGNGMEPFLEYMTAEFFKKKGYVVETQLPLSHKWGSPDFGGYKFCQFKKKQENFTNMHLIELSLIRLGYKNINRKPFDGNSIIVGEAKTSTSTMTSQLEKYKNTNLFNECFEIHFSKKYPSKTCFGLVTLVNNKIIAINRKSKELLFEKSEQKKYILWLYNYLKYYLIANLTNMEFNDFFKKKNNRIICSVNDVVCFVNKLSYEEIMDEIVEVYDGAI